MKWIAVLLMVLDHIGYYFEGLMPDTAVFVLRVVGRLAFPLFAYSVAAGYLRTSSKQKYFWRMLSFAFLTELLLYLSHLATGAPFGVNVLFTFALSILCMVSCESLEAVFLRAGTDAAGEKTILLFGKSRNVLSVLLLSGFGLAGVIFLTIRFAPDYHLFGLASVLFFYYARKNASRRDAAQDFKPEPAYEPENLMILAFLYLILNLLWMAVRILALGVSLEWSMIQIFSVAAIFLLPAGKSRTKPKKWEKYFFYVFYPAHLVIFMFLRYAFLQMWY